jgi:hypothetical protein
MMAVKEVPSDGDDMIWKSLKELRAGGGGTPLDLLDRDRLNCCCKFLPLD